MAAMNCWLSFCTLRSSEDLFRRGRFRRASGGPVFSLAGEKTGGERIFRDSVRAAARPFWRPQICERLIICKKPPLVMLCTIRGGAICKANGEGDVLQGSACSKIYSSQIPSRVFCTARSDRFSTVSTWLSTSCISQRFPATIYCGGRPLFARFCARLVLL